MTRFEVNLNRRLALPGEGPLLMGSLILCIIGAMMSEMDHFDHTKYKVTGYIIMALCVFVWTCKLLIWTFNL